MESGNDQQKMTDEGYQINMIVAKLNFICFFVGPSAKIIKTL